MKKKVLRKWMVFDDDRFLDSFDRKWQAVSYIMGEFNSAYAIEHVNIVKNGCYD